MGRPKRYSDDDLDMAVKMADQIGLKEAAAKLGIGYKSIYRHRQNNGDRRPERQRLIDENVKLKDENAKLRDALTKLRTMYRGSIQNNVPTDAQEWRP